ncbi:TetR/AcrR family transcriptional regulator [Mycobacteroides franklinii]|uniref:Putative HTH-type transcriptional regulator YxaF n=1 Tax=Mycobacteroides franklinii TaxID=948102 RepID=A0A4R8R202_9MYCO|nr:TetR/AcrR family transcriptional regulator [Mycobacteroides franklinii]TDZ45058.1 putative HTH-type transcriptional regulator YxaF [Mycobacteroides franklinii]TDZ48548.1 putative HTH-type transcriptional regulator YxaF [Mycobacteroides franklinii]TDZ58728.1 putative HTH-type transcriptional regulator YxaF [Mycobacteroides franklinii]TDZ66244.1 putative HTH-type transcriptional regulator YxaF [Mycobacteroides franklinii]TDZ72167.1 putative HTH-type transcriptional regulator YxaF [Mycobactero
MPADTRDRIVAATCELFRRQGMTGTGLKQIARSAGAPFGSIYHFFPGGKAQLADEAIRASGAMYRDLVLAIFDQGGPDLASTIRTAFAAAAENLIATDYADACPIATIALEVASTDDALRRATADVFTDWIEQGAERIAGSGLPPEARRSVILGFITSLEGAFVLSRALRSPEPLLAAGETVAAAATIALAAAVE